VKASSLNLKAVKLTQNLSQALDATLTSIIQLNTVKNYRNFLPISNFSTCDSVNIRMSFIDLDMNKFRSVISDIETNFTKIYENFNLITFNYALNLRTLSMSWTRERSVFNTFKQFLMTIFEYFRYIGMLKNTLMNFGNLQTFMTEISSNCTFSSSSFADRGNKIEDNLIKCEGDLINSESQAIQKIDAALMTVTKSSSNVKSSAPILKATTTPSDKKLTLQKMKDNLKKSSTTKNYKKVSWPRIPDTSGASGMKMKLRAAQEKKSSYSRVWKDHFKNRTSLEKDQNELSSTLQLGRRKRSTDPAIDDVLNATFYVQSQFTTCMQLLNESMDNILDTVAPCGKFQSAHRYFCLNLSFNLFQARSTSTIQ
jgi:hypothetical protein